MNVLKDKLIVYDSDCPLCTGLKEQALRFGIITDGDYTAYNDLPQQYSHAVDPERFRNEMALVDREGGRTLYGTEGLMCVFSTRYPLLEPLFAMPSLRTLFTWLYRIVAPNRYVLSTPRAEKTVCACLHAGSRSDRLHYIIASVVLSLVLTALFAFSIRTLLPNGDWPTAIVAIASGWAVYLVIAAVALRRIFLEVAAHAASVMWRGTAVLVPVLVASVVTSASSVLLPLAIVCVAVSFCYMCFQQIRRVRALCLSDAWIAVWALALWAGSLGVAAIAWRLI